MTPVSVPLACHDVDGRLLPAGIAFRSDCGRAPKWLMTSAAAIEAILPHSGSGLPAVSPAARIPRHRHRRHRRIHHGVVASAAISTVSAPTQNNAARLAARSTRPLSATSARARSAAASSVFSSYRLVTSALVGEQDVDLLLYQFEERRNAMAIDAERIRQRQAPPAARRHAPAPRHFDRRHAAPPGGSNG